MSSTLSVHAPSQHGILATLSYPNFRLYFITQLISVSGTWMQKVASGWLVFYLTRSELWLGLIACAAGLPALLFSPFAGVIVDRFPKRYIIMFTQTVQMILAMILTTLVFTDTVQIWHIVILSFLSGMMDALDGPARQAFIIEMVDRENLSNGIMLNSIMNSTARVFGPTFAGIALVQWGAGWCFFLNGLSFLVVIIGLWMMHISEYRQAKKSLPFLKQFREGLSYSRRHPIIAPVLLLATVSSIFFLNMMTLMPAFADVVLHSPKEGYAILNAANGVGAVCAGLLAAWLHKRIKRRGLLVVVSALFTPFAIFVLSTTTITPIASFVIAIYGLALILKFVTMNTLIQAQVPDEFRGRVMSLYTLTFFGIAPFGALVLGYIANIVGTPVALSAYALIGGILSAWIIWKAPELRRVP
jgi:MFS family permease